MRTPKYRRQKFRKQAALAFVEIDGKRHYLGKHGTPESRQQYDRLIAEWLANGRKTPAKPSECPSVIELVAVFWTWAKGHYLSTSGLEDVRQALKPLKELYGDLAATEFGPKKLKAIRQTHIDRKLCRKTINERIAIIKRVFKRGVAEEMIPSSVFESLRSVEGLHKGRSPAKESRIVRPVVEDAIEAVRARVSKQVKALIDLQLLTGARPGELVALCWSDLDTSEQPWKFKMEEHKTAHHGHDRTIRFGPKSQEILCQYRLGRSPDAPLFSPAEAEQERKAEQHKRRKTPLSCGNRPGKNRVKNPKRPPSDCYTVTTYRKAIARACDLAYPHPTLIRGDESKEEFMARLTKEQKAELSQWRRDHRWHPHQLRHNFATRIRREYGIDAAQPILGHARGSAITEVYAEADNAKADQVILKAG